MAEARRWIGVPYRHQGRNRSGLDCVGLVILVADELGIVEDSFSYNYGRLPKDALIEEVRTRCVQIEKAEPGCLVLIRWPNEPAPAHVAICTGPNLIHCYRNHGGVAEHGYRAPWPRLTHSLWRMPPTRRT